MPVFVNKVEITDDEVFAEMQYHPSKTVEEAQYQAALALTIRELFCQEAMRLGITPPVEQGDAELTREYLVNRLLEQEITVPTPTDEECERYYQRNPSVFRDQAGNVVPFAAVRESIAEYLQECSEQQAMKHYVKILAGQATIAGIALERASSPLVN